MKRLQFQYHMQLTFDSPVHDHHFTLRCTPARDIRQKILEESVKIYPKHFSSEETDSYGNHCIYGIAKKKHDHFSVDVTGIAEVDREVYLPAKPLHQIGLFRYPTRLTQSRSAVRELYQQIRQESDNWHPYNSASGVDVVGHVTEMMGKLYKRFQYQPGVTGVNTTAEEACEKGAGVCQDYAHILLALCRIEQIPCRYVAGMMLGEGASHAWIEVSDGTHWIPLDPTHNRTVDDTYLKISCGRDAQDSSLNQGVFTGGGSQKQEIFVSVSEME